MTTLVMTMVADDGDNDIDGNSATGNKVNDDGNGATGDDNDNDVSNNNDNDGDGNGAMGSGATGYHDNNGGDG